MREFDALFAEFFELAFATAHPLAFLRSFEFDLSSFDSSIEQAMVEVTTQAVAPHRPGLLLDEIGPVIRGVAETIAPFTLDASVERWLHIDSTLPPSNRDVIYFKINHGFWEQMYWLSALSFDADRMRPHDRLVYERAYLTSGFARALFWLVGRSGEDEGATVSFPGVAFGVSLSNGDVDHATVLKQFPVMRAEFKPVVLGAAAGSIGCLRALFGDRTFLLADGCFPKRGLANGDLRKLLLQLALSAQRIVFVVPPHLRGVELEEVSLTQEHLYISSTLVHQGWAASLYSVASRLVDRLERGESLLVITQSAVFSALLGLFLNYAKAQLNAKGTLQFLDLGQALDIANPDGGGQWARLQPRATGLFKRGAF